MTDRPDKQPTGLSPETGKRNRYLLKRLKAPRESGALWIFRWILLIGFLLPGIVILLAIAVFLSALLSIRRLPLWLPILVLILGLVLVFRGPDLHALGVWTFTISLFILIFWLLMKFDKKTVKRWEETERLWRSINRRLQFYFLKSPSRKDTLARDGGALVLHSGKREALMRSSGISPENLDFLESSLETLQSRFRSLTGLDHVSLDRFRICLFQNLKEFWGFLERTGHHEYIYVAGLYLQYRFRGVLSFRDGAVPLRYHIPSILHEATHCLEFQAKRAFREVWLLEGLAEYLACLGSHDLREEKFKAMNIHLAHGSHLSFEELRGIQHKELLSGLRKGLNLDGLSLVHSFYTQSSLAVQYLIEVHDDGNSRFREFLTLLEKKKPFRKSMMAAYGAPFEELEERWLQWILSPQLAESEGEEEAAEEIKESILKHIEDTEAPEEERVFYLLRYSRFLGSQARSLMGSFAETEKGSLRTVARFKLFLLGEVIAEKKPA